MIEQRLVYHYTKKDYNGPSFSLPEVIIPTPIPLERLQKVWERDANKVYRKAKKAYDQKFA